MDKNVLLKLWVIETLDRFAQASNKEIITNLEKLIEYKAKKEIDWDLEPFPGKPVTEITSPDVGDLVTILKVVYDYGDTQEENSVYQMLLETLKELPGCKITP